MRLPDEAATSIVAISDPGALVSLADEPAAGALAALAMTDASKTTIKSLSIFYLSRYASLRAERIRAWPIPVAAISAASRPANDIGHPDDFGRLGSRKLHEVVERTMQNARLSRANDQRPARGLI
jgi:hypothetical protein